MRENFTIKARWWLPGKREEKTVFGTLLFETTGKLIVTMDESLFGTTNIHESNHNIPIPLVYGLTDENKCITLYEVKGWEVGRTGWVSMELYPDYVFISEDRHWAVEDMEITNFNFCMNGFGNFFRTYSNRLISDHPTDTEVQFTYQQPDPVEIINNEILNLYFYFQYQYSGMNDIANGAFTFKERIYLNISPPGMISFKEFTKQLKFYGDFFRLFSQEILSFDRIYVFLKAPEDNKAKFRFIYRQPTDQVGRTPSVFHPLVAFDEIKNDIGQIMIKWINMREYATGGLSLFMQTKYVSFPSQTQLFLNFVFALETLHKTFFANQRSMHLSKRLEELIVQNKDILSEYQIDEPGFVDKVFRQRNYLAHDHSNEDHSHISADEYKRINPLLQMIFELSLLRLLGIEEPLLKKMCNRNDNFEQLAKGRGLPF
ncbi:MAG: HEPN domain-containing protein [Bacteroidota bacterium]